ncbi:MAG TPA: GGDEF domain-containing response regulator, partial [candidate division Zixibacteria bacterium]|nr:GGDEF domain-containing response regulator [candidate division Zixibacteria bacterium]
MATFKSLFVLVVDDNPYDADRVCGWLSKQGLSSAQVDTTEKAQTLLRERKPVCVLLDLHIPGSDTLAFLETLYNHKIPTVIFTGNGDERKAVETLKRGAIDYLIKDDLTEGILVDSLRHALSRFREKVRLDFLAHYDSLTGLVNRETFTSRLTHAAKRCRRQGASCTVMYLDIDRFKSYNDTFGHAFGDQVLQRFANRLLRCVRDEDTVARLGGDEFAVLLENSTDELVEEISERILSGINRPITICEQTVEIGSSIGTATFPETSENLAELVALADEALYFAKMNGR